MDEYETVILVKQEVFVYRIPPRTTNRGYRAADWKLDTPDWTGRMRVVSKGKDCCIKLEDKTTGELFSKSPIEKYPGIAIESVMDSSRYFVLRVEDDNGSAAFIGIGFADRGDSFDLNVALQEHFKWLQKSEEIEQGADTADSKPNLDLSFKAGETIKINMNIGKKSRSSKPRPKPSSAGVVPGLLPPPPGGVKIQSAPSAVIRAPHVVPSVVSTSNSEPNTNSASDLLLDLGSPINAVTNPVVTSSMQKPASSELWGDFTTAETCPTVKKDPEPVSANWMDF